jgi:capsular polysaccharide transport system permease protein
MSDLIAAQIRVLWAVLLRDMHTLFGRTQLGYLWAVITPLSYAGVSALVFAFTGRQPPLGESMMVFFVLGFIPFFLFRNIIFRLTETLQSSQNLLTHPAVLPNDIVFAKALLETATMLLVGLAVFLLLAWQDLQWKPQDPIGLLAAVLATALLGTGLGAVFSLMALVVRSWNRLVRLILRPFFAVSAVLFLTDNVPEVYRVIIVWNPLLHCVEWVRVSFYRDYTCVSLDRFYPILVGIICLCLSMAMERLFRRRIYEMIRS